MVSDSRLYLLIDGIWYLGGYGSGMDTHGFLLHSLWFSTVFNLIDIMMFLLKLPIGDLNRPEQPSSTVVYTSSSPPLAIFLR
jgi:hypothetical protein